MVAPCARSHCSLVTSGGMGSPRRVLATFVIRSRMGGANRLQGLFLVRDNEAMRKIPPDFSRLSRSVHLVRSGIAFVATPLCDALGPSHVMGSPRARGTGQSTRSRAESSAGPSAPPHRSLLPSFYGSPRIHSAPTRPHKRFSRATRRINPPVLTSAPTWLASVG